jgi:SAM-dependent methyltransferase
MRIEHGTLSDIEKYLNGRRDLNLDEKEEQFQSLIRAISRVMPLSDGTRMLEIGTGTGWFPILCQKYGLTCAGLEISPRLVDCAKAISRKHGLESNIQLGNIEDTDLGVEQYDVIVCSSVFEHVEYWRKGLERVYRALRPGGVLFFESTNKFSLRSGEYTKVPLYGWLPNWLRYRLRITVEGPDIMKNGIDFHQFTYFQLRRVFREIGFSRILDRVDIADPGNIKSPIRTSVLRACRTLSPVRQVVLLFFDMTTFICVK